MTAISWKSITACAAIGLTGAALFIAFSDRPPVPLRLPITGVAAPDETLRAEEVASAVEDIQQHAQPLPEQQPEAPLSAERIADEAGARAKRLAATYAATFRPGIYGAEPTPEFLVAMWQVAGPTDREQMLLEYSEHLRGSGDDPSEPMATLLREFFEFQPELASVRTAISCSSTQCKLQMTSVPADFDTEMRWFQVVDNRLRRQPWYRKTFSDMTQVGSGLQIDDRMIMYRLITLRRRHDSDLPIEQ